MINNTIQVQTAQGLIAMPLVYKKGTLQVVRVPTQVPEFFFYNTVHNNGLQVPKTNTDVVFDAILICDWCVANFPEFLTEIVNISVTRQNEFKDRLYDFRFVQLKDWDDDDDD